MSLVATSGMPVRPWMRTSVSFTRVCRSMPLRCSSSQKCSGPKRSRKLAANSSASRSLSESESCATSPARQPDKQVSPRAYCASSLGRNCGLVQLLE